MNRVGGSKLKFGFKTYFVPRIFWKRKNILWGVGIDKTIKYFYIIVKFSKELYIISLLRNVTDKYYLKEKT